MEREAVLIAAVLGVGLYPVLRAVLRGGRRAFVGSLLVFAVSLPAASVAGRALRAPLATDPAVLDRPVEVSQDGYVSSTRCRACHPDQYASWDASYHHTMTQEARPAAVAGALGTTLRAADWSYHLERRGDEIWAVTRPPGAPPVERPVVLVTGSHHYQVYWLPDRKKGVLRAFPFVFLLDEQRWIPRKAAFLSPPGPARTEEDARWNNGCSQCHSVNSKWRPVRPHTDTRVAEFGISCEACHGPADEHVRLNGNPARRYLKHLAAGGDESIVQPAKLGHRRSSEVCGQCHSVFRFESRDAFNDWAHNGHRYRPGEALADSRGIVRGRLGENTPALQAKLATIPHVLEDSFWGDGAVRVAGREYNGLLETPCFERGEMSCLSCHEMHRPAGDARALASWADDQLKPGMRTNAACTQCHAGFDAEAQLAEHTRHAPDSSGSLCQNCHMPFTTWGLMKAIRSHTIDSPSGAATVETGRPNACNQCHLKETLAWAAEQLEASWGIPQPLLSEDERRISASLLALLRGHAGQRALAAWSLGWDSAREISGDDWMVPFLAQLLLDPYDAVRFAAYRSLRRQPGFDDLEYDPLAPAAELADDAERSYARWTRLEAGEHRSTADAILIAPDGRLRRDVVARLLGQRDDRRVVFRE